MKLLVGFCCLIISPIVYGFLNEESVQEQRCVVDPPLADLNFTWVTSVPAWYFPFLSKLDLYKSAADIKNVTISEIQEHELYYDICMVFKIGQGNISTSYGFNGKKEDYLFELVSPSVFKFVAQSTNLGGFTYIALTDNKTFMLYSTCWDDGFATWSVGTTTKTLDEKTVQEIHARVKSLGFQEQHFTQLRYETCNSN